MKASPVGVSSRRCRTATASRRRDGLERFATPEQAAAAAATDAYTQLEGVDTEVVLRFPVDVALDARVRVTSAGFCRIYSASGEGPGGATAWSAFGEGLSCLRAENVDQ